LDQAEFQKIAVQHNNKNHPNNGDWKKQFYTFHFILNKEITFILRATYYIINSNLINKALVIFSKNIKLPITKEIETYNICYS
jgi:hypothetical protein